MNISLKPTPFNNIKNLTKTIEVRLYRGPFTSININDIVIFHSSNGHIAKKTNLKIQKYLIHLKIYLMN